MEAIPSFGAERSLAISAAILLYSEKENHSHQRDALTAATVHAVHVDSDGKPAIAAGAPVTVAALESLMASLGHNLENELLPARLLSLSLTRMIWCCPAQRARIWFKPNTRNDSLDKALKKLNGTVVAHPHLLFCADHHNLYVFALAKDCRPTLTTKLFRAPYFNLSQTGLLCAGSANLPATASPSLVPRYEKGFFESAFSHSNWGHQITRHPGGHLGLWQEMQAAKMFNPKFLVKTKYTLAGLLKSKTGDE